MKNETTTLSNFLEWCERADVAADVADAVEIPSVPKRDQSSNVRLDADAATALLDHYRSGPDFGTRPHALLELLWHTGARLGAIVALDLDDRKETPDGQRYLAFRNRPSSGTRLKKGADGERPVVLSATVWDALDHYVEHYRDDVTDDYGREPLITSQLGRPSKGTVRSWVYQATIPCRHSDCPHGKERATCEWTRYEHASNCPSSRSPHQIRTGAITWMRNRGLPAEAVAERVNASVGTIKDHYDKEDPVAEMLARRADLTRELDIDNETQGEHHD